MEALECYVASFDSPLHFKQLPAPDLPTAVFTYKVAKKVHPVAASLPRDFSVKMRPRRGPLKDKETAEEEFRLY